MILDNHVLCIESASKNCSVSLFKADALIDVIEEKGSYSHSENLAAFIDQLLTRKSVKLMDLAAVAISEGPGSYTGLRIGLSLAKGICSGAQIPLIAIPTLDAMSWGAIRSVNDQAALYCPMLDARRMEVYTGLYSATNQIVQQVAPKVIDEHAFKDTLEKNTVYFFGDGASKCRDLIQSENAIFLKDHFISSQYMGAIGYKKLLGKQFVDLAYFQPNYFKEFIAGKPKKLV